MNIKRLVDIGAIGGCGTGAIFRSWAAHQDECTLAAGARGLWLVASVRLKSNTGVQGYTINGAKKNNERVPRRELNVPRGRVYVSHL